MSSVSDYCEAHCLLKTLIARQIDSYIAGASILKVLLGWVLHGVMIVVAAYSSWAYCRQSERPL